VPDSRYCNLSLRKATVEKLRMIAKNQNMSMSRLIEVLLEAFSSKENEQPATSSISHKQTHRSMEGFESEAECPFFDVCPFKDPAYIEKHGYIYVPEIADAENNTELKS